MCGIAERQGSKGIVNWCWQVSTGFAYDGEQDRPGLLEAEYVSVADEHGPSGLIELCRHGV